MSTHTVELPGVFRLGLLEVTAVGRGGAGVWTAEVMEVATGLLIMEVVGRTEEEADARAHVIVAAYNEELARTA